ncbi:MAG TPA: ACP S-malonyltransferase [Candidatus Acidoferrales bacterium]|nr:ACP S-malonyltransferase [Candidatus Acidoferrales bacterium]
MRIGVVFPGQGSQTLGMGVDVAKHSTAASDLFDMAQTVLGYDLLALQRHGPEDRLRETQYSQPAIFATNVAIFAALELPPESLVVSAGHSFGEFCSLYAAGSLLFEDALRIVNARGIAMQDAADVAPGGMTAVLGMDASAIRRVVDEVRERTGARVQLANFNSPSQIVISGDVRAVQLAGDELLAAGAKRVVPLNVSGAWHSALMEPAVATFAPIVEGATFELPRFDVISNVDAQPYRDVATIKKNLVLSVTHEVRWHETAERLVQYGLDLVVECGASPVLGPLMKRLPNAPDVAVVSDFASVQSLRGSISTRIGSLGVAPQGDEKYV